MFEFLHDGKQYKVKCDFDKETESFVLNECFYNQLNLAMQEPGPSFVYRKPEMFLFFYDPSFPRLVELGEKLMLATNGKYQKQVKTLKQSSEQI